MKYYLLTGATGLLGRYLLRDMTLANLAVAVVVRPTKWESGTQRIESIMARWEQELRRALPRPVVLEGDVTSPALGLNDTDVRWLADRCGTLVHSAASLTFQADADSGEPMRTNVEGTRHVLDLCRRAAIRECHHVSTAYVCGSRRGRVLEDEVNVGQTFGNAYEESKLISESEVRACDAFESVTVYRPSIIVGDSRTGYTCTFHGFYTPLRLVHAVAQSVSWATVLAGDWLGRLQLNGDERKNLVPVDWVSAAMTRLITRGQYHGQTYHLTNPSPVTTADMLQSIAQSVGELVAGKQSHLAPADPADDVVALFGEQMKVYESYWRDDPEFDTRHTQCALPELPCPRTTHETMSQLIRYAVDANFGWPRPAPLRPPHDASIPIRRWLSASGTLNGNYANGERNGNGQYQYVNLQIVGRGGGQWHLLLDQGALVAARVGLRDEPTPICHLNSTTFSQLARGELTFQDSIDSARLVVAGNSVHPRDLARAFRDIGSDARHCHHIG